jgi:hypothetical protein
MKVTSKTLFAVAVIATLSLAGCKKNDGGDNPPQPSPLVITATNIANIPTGTAKVNLSDIDGTNIISETTFSGTGFTCNMPETISDNLLLDAATAIGIEGLTISSSTAKLCAPACFLASDSDGKVLTDISYGKVDTDSNGSVYMYVYATEDVNISGTGTLMMVQGTVQLNLKKGWNEMMYVIDRTNGPSFTYTTTLSKDGFGWAGNLFRTLLTGN